MANNGVVMSGDVDTTVDTIVVTVANGVATDGDGFVAAGNCVAMVVIGVVTLGNRDVTVGDDGFTSGDRVSTSLDVGDADDDGVFTASIGDSTVVDDFFISSNAVIVPGNGVARFCNPDLAIVDNMITSGDVVFTAGNSVIAAGNGIISVGNGVTIFGNGVATAGNNVFMTGNSFLTPDNVTICDGVVTSDDAIPLILEPSKVLEYVRNADGGANEVARVNASTTP